MKDLGNAKVVIGLTSTTEYPKNASTKTYLAYKTSEFNAGTIVADSNYTSATHIGVAFVQTNSRTYRLVCLFSVPKQ